MVLLEQNKMGISRMRQVLARLPTGKSWPMSLEYPSGEKEVSSRLTPPWKLHTQGSGQRARFHLRGKSQGSECTVPPSFLLCTLDSPFDRD